jgi:hypothetical protein
VSLRETVFSAIATDPALNALGISADNLWTVNAADDASAPEGSMPEVFAILNWGLRVPLIGRSATSQEVSLWVYDAQKDYTRVVNPAIKAWCDVCDALVSQPTGSGWILGANWQGDSADNWDDAWLRIVRDSSYTIITTGN